MGVVEIVILSAFAWVGLIGIVVALCAAAGLADRRERRSGRALVDG